MEIAESNKLVAEFMELKFEDGYYQREDNDPNGYEDGGLFWVKPQNMLYDKDWNWLMPVCLKLDEFYVEGLDFDNYNKLSHELDLAVSTYNIQVTYSAAVNLVKFCLSQIKDQGDEDDSFVPDPIDEF